MSENINTTCELGNTRADSDAIAPAWHTVVVILVLLGVAAFSMHVGREGRVGHMPTRMHTYIATITAEWLLVAFMELSVRWHGASVRTLVGENSARWRLIVRDLGLAVAFLVAADSFVFMLSYVLGHLMHPAASAAMKALLPQSRWEVAAFLLLALTAGICEEIIFRGYLQRQFTAWTESAVVGVAVQGIAFGLAHAYQGSTQVILIAVYGCMFGVLARWRGSLRAGMVAPFSTGWGWWIAVGKDAFSPTGVTSRAQTAETAELDGFRASNTPLNNLDVRQPVTSGVTAML